MKRFSREILLLAIYPLVAFGVFLLLLNFRFHEPLSILRDLDELTSREIKVEDPQITDAQAPVIKIATDNIETYSKSIGILVSSSEKIALSDNTYILEEQSSTSTFKNSITYVLKINSLKEGKNIIPISFQDNASNKTSYTINASYTPLPFEPPDDQKYTIDGDSLIALVDKEYSLFPSYYPKDLVNLIDYEIPTTAAGLTVRSVIIDDLVAMFNDAKEEGLSIHVISAYRSYDLQAITYNYWVSTAGVTEANRASAQPGHSEHQLGTTLDLTSPEIQNGLSSDFGETNEGIWLASNAYKYGFVMSYPSGKESITGYKYEPWHFRYLGKTHAQRVYNRSITTDEYLREIHGIFK